EIRWCPPSPNGYYACRAGALTNAWRCGCPNCPTHDQIRTFSPRSAKWRTIDFAGRSAQMKKDRAGPSGGAMTSIDPYRVTDKLDDTVLDTIATRLELRGKHPAFIRMMDEYLDAMGIDDVNAVIDLGCGTGVAARRIALRSGFSGHVTGIDRSPFLIRAARRLAGDEGVAGRIDFRIGDT